MKKIISLLAVFMCCTSLSAGAVDEIQTERVIITNKTGTEIEIPEYADELYIDFCNELETVTIPKYVNEIYITECPLLSSVNVVEDNADFCSVDGVVYTKNMEELVFCPQAKEGTEFTIPDGVKRISENAFQYCSFESIIIPDSVEEIGRRAFYDNTNLKRINIPTNVDSSLDTVFMGCNRLKEITFANDTVNGDETFLGIIDWDIPYSNTLWSVNAEQVIIYVPDSKITDYNLILGINSNNNYIILPISMKTGDFIPFDINSDEVINIADAVCLQNYLLGNSSENISNVDINNDGHADVFDFIIMKQIIFYNWNNILY